jgi:hypothetical protein
MWRHAPDNHDGRRRARIPARRRPSPPAAATPRTGRPTGSPPSSRPPGRPRASTTSTVSASTRATARSTSPRTPGSSRPRAASSGCAASATAPRTSWAAPSSAPTASSAPGIPTPTTPARRPTSASSSPATAERGVFASTNAGKAWRPLRDDTAGLLAWPIPDRLYLIDGQGQVNQSGDGGQQWQPAGSIGGQPAAFIAHETELYAALTDSMVKRSTDGGANWTIRATP